MPRVCVVLGGGCCRHIAPLATADDGMTLLNDPSAASRAELKELVDSLTDTQPAGALVSSRLCNILLLTSLQTVKGGSAVLSCQLNMAGMQPILWIWRFQKTCSSGNPRNAVCISYDSERTARVPCCGHIAHYVVGPITTGRSLDLLRRLPSVVHWTRRALLSPSWMQRVRRRCAPHWHSQPAEDAASQRHWDSPLLVGSQDRGRVFECHITHSSMLLHKQQMRSLSAEWFHTRVSASQRYSRAVSPSEYHRVPLQVSGVVVLVVALLMLPCCCPCVGCRCFGAGVRQHLRHGTVAREPAHPV